MPWYYCKSWWWELDFPTLYKLYPVGELQDFIHMINIYIEMENIIFMSYSAVISKAECVGGQQIKLLSSIVVL